MKWEATGLHPKATCVVDELCVFDDQKVDCLIVQKLPPKLQTNPTTAPETKPKPIPNPSTGSPQLSESNWEINSSSKFNLYCYSSAKVTHSEIMSWEFISSI